MLRSSKKKPSNCPFVRQHEGNVLPVNRKFYALPSERIRTYLDSQGSVVSIAGNKKKKQVDESSLLEHIKNKEAGYAA
jgi:hypothetical protein